MRAAAPIPPELQDGPNCDQCGAKTRLFGIEPHPDVEHTELRTYVCTQCDGVQTGIVPLRPGRMSPAMKARVVPIASRNGSVLAFCDSSAFDSETAALLSLAFEAAWNRVRLPSSSTADQSRVDRVREVLAKQVIEMGRRGERNHERLVQSALDRLAGSRATSDIEIVSPAPGTDNG